MATAFPDLRPPPFVPARAAPAHVARGAPGRRSYADAPRRIRWPLVVALVLVHAAIVVAIAMDTQALQRARRADALAVSVLPVATKPPPPPERPPRPLPVKRTAPRPLAEPSPVVLPDLPRVVDVPRITLPPDPPKVVVPAPAVAPPAPVAVAPAAAPYVAPRFDAAYLENPAPAYPSIARRQREEGRVLLRVRVGTDGRAESVEVATSSGHERLDRAALDAVRRWRFVPARRGDEAIAAFVNVPISFALDPR